LIESLLELPEHLRRRLSDSLAAGTLGPPYSPAAVQSSLGAVEEEAEVVAALTELDRTEVSPQGVALALRGASKALENVARPDLVWSGPEVEGLHSRDTRRVYEQLIGEAQRSLWASTYAYFDGPKAFKVLADRMDSRLNLSVKLLLNIARRRGDTTSPDALVKQFTEQFWTQDWPGRRRPETYYYPRSLDLHATAGVLHAKGVVVDDEAVFVTSANFTEAALDSNIEVGMLSRDRTLAASLAMHLRVLIDRGLLHQLPDR